MKEKCLHIISITLGTVLALLYGGCTSDSTNEPVEASLRELHFMLGAHNYADITPQNTHRALPNGYVIYDEFLPKIPFDEATLRCYMTQGQEVKFQGNLTYKTDTWVSKIPLDNGVYYVYGLMPGTEAGKVKLTPLSDNFENGAVMTVNGLNALVTSDVCTIVGVRGAASKVGIAEVGIELGKFGYDAQNDGSYIYMLIDHLYAAIQLNVNINSNYNTLRTIKLTKLTLRSKMANTVNVTTTLTPNTTNTSPLTATPPTVTIAVEGEGAEVEIYNGEEQELMEDNDYLTFLACTAPIATNTQFVMKTTYNVYDRKGNLIRKDCTAENVLNLPIGGLTRGQKYTFNLTVNPTYLYVLSDPDLDNPTVTIN